MQKLKKIKSKFLAQLHKDIASIKKFFYFFIFADKTTNNYETDKNTYSKLLKDNISKTYKKTEHNTYNKSNKVTMEFQKGLIAFQNQMH